jgi:hypothetical protein
VLEAGIKMGFQAEIHDNWIMMAVDMCVHSIKALEHLENERFETAWERNTLK